jgi:hypothetical protein
MFCLGLDPGEGIAGRHLPARSRLGLIAAVMIPADPLGSRRSLVNWIPPRSRAGYPVQCPRTQAHGGYFSVSPTGNTRLCVVESSGFQADEVVWTCPPGMSLWCAAPGSRLGSSGCSAFGLW